MYMQDALKWAQDRWSTASKLLLQPKWHPTFSALMKWGSCHFQELGPLEQLSIVTANIGMADSAATLAALGVILATQVRMP